MMGGEGKRIGQKHGHDPRLKSILMVEDTIKKHSGELTKYLLWKALPKSMMYPTFSRILDYLMGSGQVGVDGRGRLVWIWRDRNENRDSPVKIDEKSKVRLRWMDRLPSTQEEGIRRRA